LSTYVALEESVVGRKHLFVGSGKRFTLPIQNQEYRGFAVRGFWANARIGAIGAF
jgi:hypothetical protein